jgi:hypothetical protein
VDVFQRRELGSAWSSATARGASNAKAKHELGWTLRYPTRRDGFPAADHANGAERKIAA